MLMELGTSEDFVPPKKRIVKGKSRPKTLDLEHPNSAAKRRRTFTVQDLGLSGKSLGSLFSELDRNIDQIDALKKPQENWGLQIGGKQTYIVANTVRRIAGGIRDSGSLQRLSFREQKKIIRNMKIVKVETGVTDTYKAVKKQRAATHKRLSKASENKGAAKERKKIAREKSADKKKIAELKKQHAELKKLLAKANKSKKKTVPKAAKKKVAKKTVPKKKGRK